jgi:ubiquinone/menaquinone biosynthesis C-methylase UbiE
MDRDASLSNVREILAGHGFDEADQVRVADLLRILPKEGRKALDAGAHTGYCAEILTQFFDTVVALDLEKPTFNIPGVTAVQGDITKLDFDDNSFDCVLCAEVLEHVPALEKAAAELSRVTRRNLVIGVPFDQDLRCGRTTCRQCGGINPPYGHINSLNEAKLKHLFRMLTPVTVSFAWPQPAYRTNWLSTWLRDRSGNLNGSYDQYQTCIHCGSALTKPPERPLLARGLTFAADRLDRIQDLSHAQKPGWIHILFRKM